MSLCCLEGLFWQVLLKTFQDINILKEVICKALKVGCPFSCCAHAITEGKRNGETEDKIKAKSQVSFVYSCSKLNNKGKYSNYLTYTVKFRQHSSLKWKAINTQQALFRSFCPCLCFVGLCLEFRKVPPGKHEYVMTWGKSSVWVKTRHILAPPNERESISMLDDILAGFFFTWNRSVYCYWGFLFTVLFHLVILLVNIRLRFH